MPGRVQQTPDDVLAALVEHHLDHSTLVVQIDHVEGVDLRQAIVQFDAGNRPDLAAAERGEITLLQAYMPQPLTETEIDALIASAVADIAGGGVVGMAAMGKVMAAIRPQLAGRADMSLVSAKVKSRLNG